MNRKNVPTKTLKTKFHPKKKKPFYDRSIHLPPLLSPYHHTLRFSFCFTSRMTRTRTLLFSPSPGSNEGTQGHTMATGWDEDPIYSRPAFSSGATRSLVPGRSDNGRAPACLPSVTSDADASLSPPGKTPFRVGTAPLVVVKTSEPHFTPGAKRAVVEQTRLRELVAVQGFVWCGAIERSGWATSLRPASRVH
jgi:hypothetical protein